MFRLQSGSEGKHLLARILDLVITRSDVVEGAAIIGKRLYFKVVSVSCGDCVRDHIFELINDDVFASGTDAYT